MHTLQELVRLHRQGSSAREIARLLGMSRNTVMQYPSSFAAAGRLEGPLKELPEPEALRAAVPSPRPSQEISTVATWIPTIRTLLARDAGPRAIWDHLRRTEAAFDGSYPAVKRLGVRLVGEVGQPAAGIEDDLAHFSR